MKNIVLVKKKRCLNLFLCCINREKYLSAVITNQTIYIIILFVAVKINIELAQCS